MLITRIARRTFSTSKYFLQSTGRLTAEPFMNGTSGYGKIIRKYKNSSLFRQYIEQMYESWLLDKQSVHRSWDAFFSNVHAGALPGQAFQVFVD